jgi:hypothetical protein
VQFAPPFYRIGGMVDSRYLKKFVLLCISLILVPLSYAIANTQVQGQKNSLQSGCRELSMLEDLLLIEKEDAALQIVRDLKTEVCSGRAQGNMLKYSNGMVATAWVNERTTWYFPNGKIATQSSFSEGSVVSYSNGKKATEWLGLPGEPWNSPNGGILASQLEVILPQ